MPGFEPVIWCSLTREPEQPTSFVQQLVALSGIRDGDTLGNVFAGIEIPVATQRVRLCRLPPSSRSRWSDSSSAGERRR